MSKFMDFLTMPDVKDLTATEFINTRIGSVTIRAMTEREHSKYQKKAIGNINAKSGNVNFDSATYNLACVANHMTTPNFQDAKFLEALGESLPEDALQRKLVAGEIDEIATRIKKLSGFDTDINEDIEEAKN